MPNLGNSNTPSTGELNLEEFEFVFDKGDSENLQGRLETYQAPLAPEDAILVTVSFFKKSIKIIYNLPNENKTPPVVSTPSVESLDIFQLKVKIEKLEKELEEHKALGKQLELRMEERAFLFP